MSPYRLIVPLLLTTAATLAGGAAADPPTAQPQTAMERQTAYLSELSRRTNGAALRVRLLEQTAKELVFEWTLDYAGPRDGMFILSPVCGPGGKLTPLCSAFRIHAATLRGEVQQISIANTPRDQFGGILPSANQGYRHRADYLQVARNGVAKGKVRLNLAECLNAFADLREEFKQTSPRTIMLQFYHQPDNRAEKYDLDAWTGDLFSNPLTVTLN